jgi:hypothetical protein
MMQVLLIAATVVQAGTTGKFHPGTFCQHVRSENVWILQSSDGAIYNNSLQPQVVVCPVVTAYSESNKPIVKAEIRVIDNNNQVGDPSIRCKINVRYMGNQFDQTDTLKHSGFTTASISGAETAVQSLTASNFSKQAEDDMMILCKIPGKQQIGSSYRRSGIVSYRFDQ